MFPNRQWMEPMSPIRRKRWKEKTESSKSRTIFLQKFLSEPRRIGSITPSSSFLTRKMLVGLPWDNIDTLAELGAGTGVFTDFIAQKKKKDCRVIVVEQDPEMRHALQTNHPSFLYGARAEELDRLLESYHLPPADCIVSGLPFAAFPKSVRDEILSAVNRSLKPGGCFVAFQYSLLLRKMLRQLFRQVEIGFVPLNIPPAFVFYCKK
jgi:phospholipid N-methyltransferase